MKKSLAAAAVMLVAIAARSPSDVEASDYDQSCAKDDDCVAVAELHTPGTHGTDCSIGCDDHAINKKEKARYDEDFADSRGRCGSRTSPFCDVTGTPTCVQGTCAMK